MVTFAFALVLLMVVALAWLILAEPLGLNEILRQMRRRIRKRNRRKYH
ncbi:hypothetical protein BH10PSE2_BH10PSE2_10030 [soil metagenome]